MKIAESVREKLYEGYKQKLVEMLELENANCYNIERACILYSCIEKLGYNAFEIVMKYNDERIEKKLNESGGKDNDNK